MPQAITQLELFAHVAAAYSDSPSGRLSNAELYEIVANRANVSSTARHETTPVGKNGKRHNLFQRAVRWHVQTLKEMGVVQLTEERGVWELAQQTKRGLHAPIPGARLVAFSTKLGLAVWGDALQTFQAISEPVALCVTSPPFLLRKERAYGRPSTEAEYIDFLTMVFEPIVKNLVPGGSICINLGNDSFVPGLPARSLVNERLLLALHDRLGLQLLDRLIWHNPSKAPGPMVWASKERVQLNTAYEHIYWLSPRPELVRSDNRRVLEPHSERHLKLLKRGGESRQEIYGDGAYRLRPGSFKNVTDGRIPRNVLTRGHRCADTLQYRRDAKMLRLPTHGAKMPLSIPDFLIRFLTQADDLVVDPFGGALTSAFAAERLGRRWLVTEQIFEYLRGGGERFRQFDGFEMDPAVDAWRLAA
jgi:site-specific DNA-methyltransferase (cytosine-N4-specific)